MPVDSESELATKAVIAEASDWLVRLSEDASEATNDAFAAWLRRSPVHVREYLRAEATWSLLDKIDAAGEVDVEDLLRAGDSNVVELSTRERGAPAPPPRRKRRAFLGAAAACLFVAVSFAGYWHLARPDVYETGIGEQRRLVLADGSVIELNTRSAVAVCMTDAARKIELVRGEAYFTVAKDRGRPFVVNSGPAVVRATGTQFNVYRRARTTVVTVLEGSVSVAGSGNDHGGTAQLDVGRAMTAPVALAAGDQVEIAMTRPFRPVAVDAGRAVSWRQRRLVFDDQPLSEVVAEFNRYNARQMKIDDAALGAKRVSGVFDADKPDALVRFLAQNAIIQPIDAGQSDIVIEPR